MVKLQWQTNVISCFLDSLNLNHQRSHNENENRLSKINPDSIFLAHVGLICQIGLDVLKKQSYMEKSYLLQKP